MKKEKNEFFGKFQKNKTEALVAIKGGVVSSNTATTLCLTNESMFDADPQTERENEKDARCSAD